MKDIAVISPESVKDFLFTTFKTKEFRDSDAIEELVDKASERPLMVYSRTDELLEHAHFTAWMGMIQKRRYKNPYIHDLHWLHELYHFSTMKYDGNQSFSDWHMKMCLNEADAALTSEAYIYWLIPGLREKTFDFEIWNDRFSKKKPVYAILPRSDVDFDFQRTSLYASLYDLRSRAIRSPNPFDFQQMQIAIYARQNYEWSLTWQKSWREVESHMSEYYETNDVDFHLDWIYKKMKNDIPFYEEAFVFRKVLEETQKKGGNQILEIDP